LLTKRRGLSKRPSRRFILARVVRHEPHRAHAKNAQDLRTDGVVAIIYRQRQSSVGLNGVRTFVLERIGAQIGQKPYPVSFMAPQVHDAAAAIGRNSLHGAKPRRNFAFLVATSPLRADTFAF